MENADAIVAALGLERHPEGGWYRETWRGPAFAGGRAAGTAIYYLLEAGQRSHWHRADAAEIWHWYAGSPLDLLLSADGQAIDGHRLGPAIGRGERPQAIVPAGCWQSAEAAASWALVGCTVSPGFEFSGFTLAPPGWQPGREPPE